MYNYKKERQTDNVMSKIKVFRSTRGFYKGKAMRMEVIYYLGLLELVGISTKVQ